MEVKSAIIIEVKKNENIYILQVPSGVSYGELYDAVFIMLQGITELSRKALKEAEPQRISNDLPN